MKMMKLNKILMLLALAMLFACKPEIDDFTTTSGQADFSKYVAIGNSLTAGYADGALYRSGQLNSYPAILAYQFKAAGGGEFRQPLMFDEYGLGGRLLLDASLPGPRPAEGMPDPRNFESIANEGPFNNMGVPGAKVFHLVPGAEAFSALNPYYARFAANPGSSTVLGEAMAQDPTFFSVWAGNNDVLLYAISGGTTDSITDAGTFQMALGAILQGMTANGAKGAVANIPDITTLPYFTFMNTQVVPDSGLVLDSEKAALLNAAYAGFEQYLESVGIQWSYGFNFQEGPNAFVVEDETLPLPPPFNVRQMHPDELFLLTLPTDSLLNNGMGSVNTGVNPPMPFGIPDRYFLSTQEITEIESATGQYNQIIATLVQQFDLALVDFNSVLKEATVSGLEYDGIKFTTEFISGNTFSLDGVHLTGQGNAVAANLFIDAINSKYNAQIKPVSPRLYPGIYYYH